MTLLPATFNFEPNPYPTGLGSAGEISASDLVETIRQQHAVSLMGDTTFPWDYLLELSSQPKYHLGALGRFFHPDYGLIRARYVKFTSLTGAVAGTPVGWLMDNPTGFRWDLTNDFSLSGNDYVTGLMAADVMPMNGWYGWVIEEGINIQSVIYAGAGAPVLGEDLQWNVTGVVGSGGGRNLGKLMSDNGIVALGGGQWEIPPAAILVGWR